MLSLSPMTASSLEQLVTNGYCEYTRNPSDQVLLSLTIPEEDELKDFKLELIDQEKNVCPQIL